VRPVAKLIACDDAHSTSMEPLTYCDRLATKRWGRYIAGIEETAFRKALLGQPPGAALEIGCEGGRWSRKLADVGWSLTCIDVDAKSLAICQSRLPSARCVLASERDTTLPCADGSVSLILCIEVWPVIDSDWFLPEARRVLSPNGLIVGTIMNRTSLRGLFVRTRERRNQTQERHYPHSYTTWKRERLLPNGFSICHEVGYCWFPVQRDSDSPVVPLFSFAERALQLPRLPSLSPYVVFIARKQ